MISKDIRDLRNNITRYIKKYRGRRIYISKYNKLIGEIKFYTNEEKENKKLEIAREMLNNGDTRINLFS